MARINRYKQGDLASSLVGTPGVNQTGAMMAQNINAATDAQANLSGIAEQSANQAAQGFSQLASQALAQENANQNMATGAMFDAVKSGRIYQDGLTAHSGQALSNIATQVQAAKNRAAQLAKQQQDALDDAAADKESLQIGYGLSDLKDQALEKFGNDPKAGMDWYKDQLKQQMESQQMKDLSKSNPRIYKQLIQTYATKGGANAEKLQSDLLQRKLDNEQEAFNMDAEDYKVKAGNLGGNLGKLQDLTNLYGSAEQKRRALALKGTNGLKQLNDAQVQGARNFLAADMARVNPADPLSSNPERALANLQSGYFNNLLEASEREKIQGDLIKAIDQKKKDTEEIEDGKTFAMKADAEVIYSRGINTRDSGDTTSGDQARATLAGMKDAYVKSVTLPNGHIDPNKAKIATKTIEWFNTKIASLATQSRGIESDKRRQANEAQALANQSKQLSNEQKRLQLDAAKVAQVKRLTSDEAVNARTGAQQKYQNVQQMLGEGFSNMQGTREEYDQIKGAYDSLIKAERDGFIGKDESMHKTWENQVAYLRNASQAVIKKRFAPTGWETYDAITGGMTGVTAKNDSDKKYMQDFSNEMMKLSDTETKLRYATAPAPPEVQRTFNFTGDPREAERLNAAQQKEFQRLTNLYKPQSKEQWRMILSKSAQVH